MSEEEIDRSVPEPDNRYTLMQQEYYKEDAANKCMLKSNHESHNANPDYWEVLVAGTGAGWEDRVGMDFGCGTGRNIINLIDRFRRFDGVDISQGLLDQARDRLIEMGYSDDRFRLYCNDGISLEGIPGNEYDFVMSTITLQHICVYTIRFNLLKEFLRVLKPGGLLSIQMRFRHSFPDGRRLICYHANHYDAKETNDNCDVIVTEEKQLADDLEVLGFRCVTLALYDAWEDDPSYRWIYANARK